MANIRSFVSFARRQPWMVGAWGVLLLLIVEVCGGVVFAIHWAVSAKEIAQQNAQEIANLNRSPFVKVTLDAVFDGATHPRPPSKHALVLPVCEQWGAIRSAVVSRDITTLVGRKVTTPTGFSQNLTPGLERMTVANNPNRMTPKLFAASNWPRYQYVQYNTFLQALIGGSAADPMATITLYIIDYGQPWKPGEPLPQGPGPHDPPQPSCPISSATPAMGQ